MELTNHPVNGIVSLVLSVDITVLTEEADHEWTRSDALLSVAIVAFLSGALTSYFAKGAGGRDRAARFEPKQRPKPRCGRFTV